MSVNVFGKCNNKWDNINVNEEQMFNSKFQDAAVNSAIASLKYLSPTDQVKMGLGVMGKPAIDTADDAMRHQVIQDAQDEIATLKAKLDALTNTK